MLCLNLSHIYHVHTNCLSLCRRHDVLINFFRIFTRTAYKDILLNFRVEVTQQLIRDYRNRKRGHAPQNALGSLKVFLQMEPYKINLEVMYQPWTKIKRGSLRFFRNCGRQQCSKQFFRTFVPFKFCIIHHRGSFYYKFNTSKQQEKIASI